MKITKTCLLLFTVIVCFFPVAFLTAQVEISGFVDVHYQQVKEETSSFQVGPYEIDFAWQSDERAAFEGAIVVDGNEVGLGQTLVDLRLFQEKIGLQMGILDMPFGIDYELFATPDRNFINPPLTTEYLMDGGWGDVGVNLYGSFRHFNFNLYLVNGMGLEDGIIINQIQDNNNHKTPGGRIEARIFKGLSMGASYVRGKCGSDHGNDMWDRKGLDLKAEIAGLQIRSEYIMGRNEIGGNCQSCNGAYLQTLYPFKGNSFIGVRFGATTRADENNGRISLVGGYRFTDNIVLKAGFETATANSDQQFHNILLQSVVSF